MRSASNAGDRRAMGPSPSGRSQLDARAELFAGADVVRTVTASSSSNARQFEGVNVDQMDSRQVMDHALMQHRDTTASARRALQVVESSKSIQASTLSALKDQGDQMTRVADDMEKIGADLSYSERILRFMRLCCCVGFFCACCTEPARDAERDAEWRGDAGHGGGSRNDRGGGASLAKAPSMKKSLSRRESAAAAAAAQRAASARTAATYGDVRTDGLADAGFASEVSTIQEETAKQNDYLDQISAGLDQLKAGAATMRDELGRQETGVDRLRGDADVLHGRLNHVNSKGFRGI